MDWHDNINQVIDYMENQMLEELDLEKIARLAGYSLWEFQRVFSFLTNTTVGNYIRKRKLSLAAQDIKTSDEKIVDIAQKYGYESSAAFSRAFSKLFGLSPSSVRDEGTIIELYPRLSLDNPFEKRSVPNMNQKFSNEEREKCIPIIKQIVELTKTSRNEGILAMEERANKPDVDPFLTHAINIVVEGFDAELVKGMLTTILDAEQYEGYEVLKGHIIIEGVISIMRGERPRILEAKLASFLGLEYAAKIMAANKKSLNEEREQYIESLKTKKRYTESEPFEKIINELDNRGVQQLLREIDQKQLTYAIKTCGYETVNKFMYNLSKRLANIIYEDAQTTQDNIELSVQNQNEIIAIYQKLLTEGKIVLNNN